ncbi:MAG: hypothetical protein NPINA01_32230 [Nitrospinaceae bacterium]|jgi:hypothetical protein|nr:MAG: hypothetical protein NPINA01_32230 [Nitrospinaceae bacterium]
MVLGRNPGHNIAIRPIGHDGIQRYNIILVEIKFGSGKCFDNKNWVELKEWGKFK